MVTFLKRVGKCLLDYFSLPFFRRGAKGSKAQGAGGVQVAQFDTDPPALSTIRPILPPEAIQNGSQTYCRLAQHLHKLSPPDLCRLPSGDVRITDTAPFASGGFSEVWRGLFQGRQVAVKSFRCYSSSEFNPAEVAIVSLHHPL